MTETNAQREVEWARMTAPELKALAMSGKALAILPAGALEQHGPHLPVIVDTASANAASLAAAQEVAADMPVAVLPPLWMGMSEHHLPFGGTISLDYAAYRAVLAAIVRSLKAIGFARLLIVNGHGGNIEGLNLSARELAVEYDMPIATIMPWMNARAEITALMESAAPGHACEGETSLMLAIAGDVVRTEKFEEAASSTIAPTNAPPGVSRFYSFAERAPQTGVMGDPRKATAAKGEAVLAIHKRLVVEAIRNERVWSQPDAVWQEGRGLRTQDGPLAPSKS